MEAVSSHPQAEYFQLLEEFFERATGMTASAFATVDGFSSEVRRSAESLAPRGLSAFTWFEKAFSDHMSMHGTTDFSLAKRQRGSNLVLGGSSRFHGSQYRAVIRGLLLADAVLVPDPVLPWFEDGRTEERFRHVHLLQQVHGILHLKPLIDSDFGDPAVVVFPSWERMLESQDSYTQRALGSFIAGVVGNELGLEFESLMELSRYAEEQEEAFLRGIESAQLLVAPGGAPGDPLRQGINAYRKEISRYRDERWQRFAEQASDSAVVLNGLQERLSRFYHLLENADELSASPLLCLESHWHYLSKCASFLAARVRAPDVISSGLARVVEAIAGPALQWLDHLRLEDVVSVRREGGNQEFRRRLGSEMALLHESARGDLAEVTSRVLLTAKTLVREYDIELEAIRARFQKKYAWTAVAAAAAATTAFIPLLAPLVGATAPLVIGASYAAEKLDEIDERKRAQRSLMGVLAKAESRR
jgi:hypothetical protein